jgi:hypothetical protein
LSGPRLRKSLRPNFDANSPRLIWSIDIKAYDYRSMPKTRLLPRELTKPHPERLSESHPFFEEIMCEHNESIALEEPGYIDPETGFFVFNAKALADQGKCCANICRHCPFKR